MGKSIIHKGRLACRRLHPGLLCATCLVALQLWLKAWLLSSSSSSPRDTIGAPQSALAAHDGRCTSGPAAGEGEGVAAQGDRGVLYFAYQRDLAKAEAILERARKSIESLKRHNPCLRVAVATNLHLSEYARRGIDTVIPISAEDLVQGPAAQQGRQWWTRMLYLSKSPYAYTLQLDSDRAVCGDVTPIFQHLEAYDFVQVSAGVLPGFDNGVMAWKRGPQFDKLLAAWKKEMVLAGMVGDDQGPLARALDKLPDVKVGVMRPTYQAKFVPAKGELWGSAKAGRTLVMHGPVQIVAGELDLCTKMNAHADRPRIMTLDHSEEVRTAFSQQECDEHLQGACGGLKELDWELDFNIMSRRLYLQRYA